MVGSLWSYLHSRFAHFQFRVKYQPDKSTETFIATVISRDDGISTVRTGFGAPASNDAIICDAVNTLGRLNLDGGRGIKFTGPMSTSALSESDPLVLGRSDPG
jgi:hypothetical protein